MRVLRAFSSFALDTSQDKLMRKILVTPQGWKLLRDSGFNIGAFLDDLEKLIIEYDIHYAWISSEYRNLKLNLLRLK